MMSLGIKARTGKVGEIIFSSKQKALVARAAVLFAVLAFAPDVQALTLSSNLEGSDEASVSSATAFYWISSVPGVVDMVSVKFHKNSSSGIEVGLECKISGASTTPQYFVFFNPFSTSASVISTTTVSGPTTDYSDCDAGVLMSITDPGGSAAWLTGSSVDVYSGGMVKSGLSGLSDIYFSLSTASIGPEVQDNFLEIISPDFTQKATTTSPVTITVRGRLDSDTWTATTTSVIVSIGKYLSPFQSVASTTKQRIEFDNIPFDELFTRTYTLSLSPAAYSFYAYYDADNVVYPYSHRVYGGVDVAGALPYTPLTGEQQALVDASESCEQYNNPSWWSVLDAGSICRTVVYLFYPRGSVLNVQDITIDFQNDFPINVYLDIRNAFQNLASTTSDTDLSIDLPGFGSRATSSVVLIDKSFLRELTVAVQIRFVIASALWLIFGLYLFKRINKFI